MSAAAKAKRVNPDLEVTAYEKGPYISYAACGLPYYVAGDVPNYQDLIVRTPQQMAQRGVQVHVHHEATAIDPDGRAVRVRDLGEGREFIQEYDHLVIATGARPAGGRLAGSDLEGVFPLRSIDQGRSVRRFLVEREPQRAVIIGGGYIGVEMAETLRHRGLDVFMLIRSGKVLRTALDDDVRLIVEEELARQGVRIATGCLAAFEGRRRVEAVVTDDERYPCDISLMGIGVRPAVGLAQQAGVALGGTGAIATDSRMRTNLPGVYAAGDCAEAFNLVTGQPDYIPLGSTANKQGRVAGTNVAGGEATFEGVVGTMVVRAFDLAVARTGLTATQARALGHAVEKTKITAKDISHYMPGAADIHVKLVVDGATARLLGGQIVGQKGVAKRIDVLATALQHRLTVSDLQRLDLSYAPPFAPVWDPILIAANVAAK